SVASCSFMQADTHDIADFCQMTSLYMYYVYSLTCRKVECEIDTSFVHHWGGLKFITANNSSRSFLSGVDIVEAGYPKTGDSNGSLSIDCSVTINNVNIVRSASNGLVPKCFKIIFDYVLSTLIFLIHDSIPIP